MDDEEKLLIADGKVRGFDYEICKNCKGVITASCCIQCGHEND